MTLRTGDIVVDCRDARRTADFWCGALGYQVTESNETGVAVVGDSSMPTLLFLQSSDLRPTKNRIHFDLRPVEGTSQDDEVARLEALGARRVEIGHEEAVPYCVGSEALGGGNFDLPRVTFAWPSSGPNDQVLFESP